MKKEKLTQEDVRFLFNYDPDTGIITWKNTECKSVRIGDVVGAKHKYGYLLVYAYGKNYPAHRIIWLYVHGNFPEKEIDHINHIRDDNRICNLRSVTSSENSRNQTISSRNTTGVTGVSFNKSKNKYQSQIRYRKKDIWLGTFDNIEEAKQSRKQAEIKYGYHQNHGEDLRKENEELKEQLNK